MSNPESLTKTVANKVRSAGAAIDNQIDQFSLGHVPGSNKIDLKRRWQGTAMVKQPAPLSHAELIATEAQLAGADQGHNVDKRDSKGRLRSGAGRIALVAALTGLGGVLAAKTLSETPAPANSHPSPVASLTKTPGDMPENGIYEVTIGQNGNVYGGLEAIARAEGKNPQSTPVSEALNTESRQMQSDIESSPSSLGEVTPGTHFDVTPDSKIVDPNALKAAEPQEVITKVG